MSNFNEKTTVGINAGSVEYSAEEAAVEIDELIELLEQAKEDGATHVVGFSGNYRGARYVRLGDHYDWIGED
jgi:hypothetical protein